MKKLTHTFIDFLPLAIAITGLSMLIYISIQQLYRAELNDPQIQIVRDAESALLSGKAPAEVIGRAELFDIQKSQRPFIAIYDTAGNVLESNASIGNKPPVPPIGVFAYAKIHGENRITWQPNATTRIALVVRPVAIESGWYVASGRNMSLTEERITTFGNALALETCVLLFLVFLITCLLSAWRKS